MSRIRTNSSRLPKIIAILGPTASGKSSFAMAAAGLFPCEIVSCDSVQIYRYLDIGSAKPSPDERNSVTHHLIDVFDPDFRADTGLYKKLAEETILDVQNRGKVPILVGGTGLYFNALYYGMFDGPSKDDNIRRELDERWEQGEREQLFDELRSVDPASAEKIQPADKRRIVRALEVYRLTGRPLSELYCDNDRLELDWRLIGLNPDRAELYRRIESRVDNMLSGGLIEETRGIVEGFGENAYALQSIGYRHVLNHLNGVWSLEETASEMKKDTRHYAKRQMTWFRKNRDVHWYDPAVGTSKLFNDVRTFLEGS